MFRNLANFPNFIQILAIEKHLILEIFILNITFWLYIAQKKGEL
jgi:hypothetical protein